MNTQMRNSCPITPRCQRLTQGRVILPWCVHLHIRQTVMGLRPWRISPPRTVLYHAGICKLSTYFANARSSRIRAAAAPEAIDSRWYKNCLCTCFICRCCGMPGAWRGACDDDGGDGGGGGGSAWAVATALAVGTSALAVDACTSPSSSPTPHWPQSPVPPLSGVSGA